LQRSLDLAFGVGSAQGSANQRPKPEDAEEPPSVIGSEQLADFAGTVCMDTDTTSAGRLQRKHHWLSIFSLIASVSSR
jgi:hypothetical protein